MIKYSIQAAKIKKPRKSERGETVNKRSPRKKTRFTVKRIILPLVGISPIVGVSGKQGREIRTEAQPCHSHVHTTEALAHTHHAHTRIDRDVDFESRRTGPIQTFLVIHSRIMDVCDAMRCDAMRCETVASL